jgi:hypothetical protein
VAVGLVRSRRGQRDLSPRGVNDDGDHRRESVHPDRVPYREAEVAHERSRRGVALVRGGANDRLLLQFRSAWR